MPVGRLPPAGVPWYVSVMANPYGVKLDDRSLRWAAAEGVSESVIAAICLLDAKSVDEIVAKLSPAELGQVINIVGRSPSCYPPGVYAALKGKRDLASLHPQMAPTPTVTARQQARPPENATAPQSRAQCQSGASLEVVANRSAAAERMRQYRERRRQGLRCLTIELHVTEIDALVGSGLLKAEMRNDPEEVTVALYEHLNRTLGARL
jgi:hypothetical protein